VIQSPSAVSISSLWAGACDWLTEQWGTHDWRQITPDHLLQLLVAAGLCQRFGGLEPGGQLVMAIGAALPECWSAWNAQALGEAAQPLLVLLGNEALRHSGGSSPLLDEVTALLLQELAQLPEADLNTPSVLMLRDKLGQIEESALTQLAQDGLLPPQQWLRLEIGQIHQQAVRWGLLTRFGTRPVPAELVPALPALVDVVSAIALTFCRNQQLDLAGELLRLLTYVGGGERALQEGIDFLAFQQRSSGAFGYINPLAVQTRLSQAERDLRFHLPLTVAALHTLGEVFSADRLMLRAEGRNLG
jgi:hypothetical protein